MVALFATLTDRIMLAMRLVSILASLVSFAMIYALCRLRHVTPLLSFVAAGLCAAAYGVTGFWFDVGRVDSLFLALLLTGYVLAMVRTERDGLVGALAGLVVFLAYATKQTALVAIPFLIGYLLVERHWLKALAMGAASVLACGLFMLIMNLRSDGWFWLYVYRIPSAHPIVWSMVLRDFWSLYLFPGLLWLAVISVLGLAVPLLRRERAAFVGHATFATALFVPLAIMSVGSAAKQWGYLNGLLPIVAALTVVGVEAYQRLASAALSEGPQTQSFRWLYYGASLLMLLQFGALRYDFRAQVPAGPALSAGYRLVDLLRDAEQPIFIPTSPYLLAMAGQPTHFHASSLGDLALAAQHDPALSTMLEAYTDAISAHLGGGSIRTAILPDARWYDAVFGPAGGYTCTSLVADQPPLRTLTGAVSYLERICRAPVPTQATWLGTEGGVSGRASPSLALP